MASDTRAVWSASAEERASARAERRARVAAIMSQVREWRAANPTEWSKTVDTQARADAHGRGGGGGMEDGCMGEDGGELMALTEDEQDNDVESLRGQIEQLCRSNARLSAKSESYADVLQLTLRAIASFEARLGSLSITPLASAPTTPAVDAMTAEIVPASPGEELDTDDWPSPPPSPHAKDTQPVPLQPVLPADSRSRAAETDSGAVEQDTVTIQLYGAAQTLLAAVIAAAHSSEQRRVAALAFVVVMTTIVAVVLVHSMVAASVRTGDTPIPLHCAPRFAGDVVGSCVQRELLFW